MDLRTSFALPAPAVKGMLQFCRRAYPLSIRTGADLLLTCSASITSRIGFAKKMAKAYAVKSARITLILKGRCWTAAALVVASQSCSLRIFFRARFRAKACFTRRFSPGFR